MIKNAIKTILRKAHKDAVFHPCAAASYEGPKVAFVHIAKCGGISVDQALREAIASPGQRRINREAILAANLASFGREITEPEDSYDFSEHHAKMLTGVFDYYLAKKWNYVSGHVTVDTNLLDKYKEQYKFVTVLRDPVERYISNYLFNKKTNAQQFMMPNKLSTDNLVEEAKEILNSRRGWQLANTTTMFLTGRYPKTEHDAQFMRKEVKTNLSKFDIVGFLSEIDAFEAQCTNLTGINIDIKERNKGKDHKQTLHNEEFMRLETFFRERDTLKKIETLCKNEIYNYQAAMNSHSLNK